MLLKNKLKKAFTLVELVVVIAVIAILTGVSVGAYIGVTDNANRSNALVAQNEAKKLWNMFLASEYDNSISLEKNAENFCLDYFPANNDTVDLNFKEVEIISSTSTNNKYVLNEAKSSNKGLIIKIDTNYPSFIVSTSKGIIETSNITKNEKDFISNINSSSYISDEYKTLFSKYGSDELMELHYIETKLNGQTIKTRGYKCINVNIGNNVYKVKNCYSLGETYPELVPNVINIASDTSKDENGNKVKGYGYNFEYKLDNKEFDVYKKITTTKNSVDSINLNSNDYIVDEITLNKIDSTTINEANITNYPVIAKQNDDQYYFSSFSSMISADEDNKIDFKLNNSNNYNYIFVGNTTLYNDFTLPSNYILVVDNFDVTTSEVTKYSAYYNSSDSFSLINSKDTSNDSPNEKDLRLISGNLIPNGEVNAMGVNTIGENKYTFTINEGVTLTLSNNSKLDVLATVEVPSNGSGGFSLPSYSTLENNGIININDGAIFRSLGITKGSGKINALNGSTVYEIFKITDFKGGNVTGMYNAEIGNVRPKDKNNDNTLKYYYQKLFPFTLYYIDNIKCNTYFNYGSNYNLYSCIYAGSELNQLMTTFISNTKGLFKFNSDDTILIKNVDENNKTNIVLEKGSLIDDEFILFFKGWNSDLGYTTKDVPLPLNNINIKLNSNTRINISKNRLYLLNSSSLNIEKNATLIIEDESYIIDTYLSNEALDTTINEASKYIKTGYFEYINNKGNSTGKYYKYVNYNYYKTVYEKMKIENIQDIIINGNISGNFYSNLIRCKSDSYDLDQDLTSSEYYENIVYLFQQNAISKKMNEIDSQPLNYILESTNCVQSKIGFDLNTPIGYTSNIDSIKDYYKFNKVIFNQLY